MCEDRTTYLSDKRLENVGYDFNEYRMETFIDSWNFTLQTTHCRYNCIKQTVMKKKTMQSLTATSESYQLENNSIGREKKKNLYT